MTDDRVRLNYSDVLSETNKFHTWLKHTPEWFHSTCEYGTVIVTCPNPSTLEIVLENVCCSDEWGDTILWLKFTNTRLVLWHKDL
jgi:hypothetical protein